MRVLFACTQGAGHFHPLVPFIDACRRAGHEVLVVGPPLLAETVDRAGYPWWPGASPPPDEIEPVWARVPTLSFEEAERLVIAGIFATLNVRAMLPGMRAAVKDWRPDVIVREPAEFASAVVAEESGVPHVEAGIGLRSSGDEILAVAADAVEGWRAGLVQAITESQYLTLFPASLDDRGGRDPARTRRFRDPAGDAPPRPLEDWWGGDERPLVYVTFGSVTASLPPAVPIYDVALEALAGTPARVLLTTGAEELVERLTAPGPHVHIERWVAQADVLAHADVVVCHGGSGTVLGALAAGRPLVITPLFADQVNNARRIAEVGAGLVVEPHDPGALRSAVDPGTLRDAIEAVRADGAFTRVAGEIAAELRALPAADEAVSVLAAAE